MNADSKLNDTDVIVVGGGLAGLATACYLGRAGARVVLFEKASCLGGRAATQEHDGFLFNRGIHALYTGGATEEVLRELGVAYSGGSPKETFVLDGKKIDLFPSGPVSLLRTRVLGFGDKLALVRLLRSVPGLDAHALRHVSVQTWLEQSVKNNSVRRFIASLARTFVYSADLDLVSAEVFVKKLQVQLKHKVIYIDGGWQTLIAGLRKVAEAAGVGIETGVSVERVIIEEGRARGIRLHGGEVVRASAVVVATNPREAVRLVGEDASPALGKAVCNLVPAQIACLDVALQRLPVPKYPVVQDIQRPLFMSVQSLYSSIAPEGMALAHTFKQLDPGQTTADPHEDERDLEALLDRVQPGWRDLVVKRFFLPRIDAVGALPTAKSGGFEGRPGPQAANISGLYLAGDWIGSEGFLSDASTASGREVARMLLQGGLARKS